MTRKDAAALRKSEYYGEANKAWLSVEPQPKPRCDYFSMIGSFCIGVMVMLAAIGFTLGG